MHKKNFFEGMFLDKRTRTHVHTLHKDPLPTKTVKQVESGSQDILFPRL